MNQAWLPALLTAGISASSADNSQPWQVRVQDDRIELDLDEARLGMFFDPAGAASLMSCGGFCELVRIAATGHRLAAEINLFPAGGPSRRVAEIVLRAAATPRDALLDGIQSRGTHRGHYRRWREVEPDVLERAAGAAAQIAGHRVVWLRGHHRRAATRLVYRADALRFGHREVHEQFFEKLRFGADAERCCDGLAWDTLGVERMFRPVLRLVAPWSVTSRLNRLGWNYVMAVRGAWVPCVTAAGLGAVVQERQAGYFAAGRALHRLWIALNQAGLAFQPLGALPLFLMRLDELRGQGFSPSQLATLQALQARLNTAIPGFVPERERLILIFRYGYPFWPAPKSRRRPVTDFFAPPNAEPPLKAGPPDP